MLHDFRHAIRSLTKTPGFATAAIVTLALGIGATTVVFSFVNGLILRPLPFGDATPRIVSIHGTHATQFPDDWDDANISYADLLDVGRESTLLEAVGGFFDGLSFTLYGEDTVRVSVCTITPNLFEILNVEPAIGRGFREDEGARIGFESVVLLSDGLWKSRFGGDPNIVGETIVANERELTVIGIMPERFRYPERADIWLPYDPGEGTNRAGRFLIGVGRVAEAASLEQARREIDGLAGRLASRYPDTNRGWGLHLLPYRDLVVDDSMRVIAGSLLAAVGLVLLIGCANLASLLLARGTARQREIAVRSALGAGRARLIRQMLVESTVLGVAGGAFGTLLALWGLDATVASFPEELPYWLSFDIDWRVASFIIGLSLATSIAFGLLPALRASKLELSAALGSGRDPAAGRGSLTIQAALIIGQVALSLALLVGAGLMYQSFLNLRSADPGFETDKLLSLRVYLAGDTYDPVPSKIAFFSDVVERLRELSGVASATATTAVPTDDGGAAARIVTPENPVPDGTELGVHVIGALPGFFETLDVPLVEGRAFTARDLAEDAAPIAIVNQRLADRLWPGVSAEDREIGLVTSTGVEWRRVVGVSPHIQYEEFGEETAQSAMNVFVPYSRTPFRGMALLVRSEGDPGALAAPIREALKTFAPGLPVYLVRTMEEVRFMTTWEQRFFSHLFNGFAIAALLLACLGIYGLVAYRVSRREHEIGVRMALGAQRKDVVRLVLGQGVALAGAGIALGLVISLAVARVLASALYAVPPQNPTLFAATASLLGFAVLTASYLPARRAAEIKPMAALRED